MFSMSSLAENLAHFANGMAFMFFILTAFQLYRYRNKNQLMKFFFWEMVFFSFLQFSNTIYLVEGIWYSGYLPKISLSFDMWSIPLTMMLIFEIISPGWSKWNKILALLSPSILFLAGYILFPNNTLFYISVVYTNILGIVALFIIFLASSKYDNYIKNNFSYTENLSLYWIRWIVIPLYFALFIWNFIIWKPSWMGDAFYYFFIVVIWTFIYHYTSKHAVVEVPDLLNPFSKKGEILPEPVDLAENEEINRFPFAQKIDLYMNNEKLYLNPKLTITELASELGTNRTYLSDYLNNQLNTNFYEYVNDFRVKEACMMLISGTTENLEIIAETCGFNSLSTFRRSFVKKMGKTPLQYKKANHPEEK